MAESVPDSKEALSEMVLSNPVFTDPLPEPHHTAMVREVSDLYETLESIVSISNANSSTTSNSNSENGNFNSSLATFGRLFI